MQNVFGCFYDQKNTVFIKVRFKLHPDNKYQTMQETHRLEINIIFPKCIQHYHQGNTPISKQQHPGGNQMKSKLMTIIKKESKIIAASLFAGILLALTVAAYTYVYSSTVQQNIASNVIRFHVLANSDSVVDQNLKDRVRLEVLAEFEEVLSVSNDIKKTRSTLTAKLPQMEAIAQQVILRNGFDYHVSANITRVFFPTGFYGNMSFPPGEYEAVQIIIGEGRGSNWWCLMFPPLCYVDMTSTEAGRRQLAETVTEEGFRLLMHQEEESQSLAVRFKIVEWWQNRKTPEETEGIFYDKTATTKTQ